MHDVNNNHDPVFINEKCMDYIPEKGNPYPLCDNLACTLMKTCNISAHMDEEPYYSN